MSVILNPFQKAGVFDKECETDSGEDTEVYYDIDSLGSEFDGFE